MKDCCICQRQITSEKPAILFIGTNGDYKEICTVCEQKFKVITENYDYDKTQKAIYYFETCLSSATDEEVRNYIETVEDNVLSYHKTKESGRKSFWIMCVRIISLIIFFLIIFVGTIFPVHLGPIGILVFLGVVMLAFLSVGMIMIFLDMAEDVAEIRKKLK
jgi:hypothetical protein